MPVYYIVDLAYQLHFYFAFESGQRTTILCIGFCQGVCVNSGLRRLLRFSTRVLWSLVIGIACIGNDKGLYTLQEEDMQLVRRKGEISVTIHSYPAKTSSKGAGSL